MPDPIPLSEALPELASHFDASAAPLIDAEWVRPGPFRPERIGGAVVVMLSGAVIRTTVLDDGVASELLGPGAVLCPPGSGRQDQLGLPGCHFRFEALQASRVGIVGPALLAALAELPELIGALLAGRGRQDAERAAMQAICRLEGVDRRLLALFRLLAARHGRPAPDGIVVPVALAHRLLAELVGARRPTVTTALRDLRHSGRLRRLGDGSWLLQQRSATRSRPGGRFERRRG